LVKPARSQGAVRADTAAPRLPPRGDALPAHTTTPAA